MSITAKRFAERDHLIRVEVKLPWWWPFISGLEITTSLVPDDDPPIPDRLVPDDVRQLGRRRLFVFYEVRR